MMNHQIKKQTIELHSTSSNLDVLNLQSILITHFYSKVIADLSDLFDTILPQDEYLKIERIEIELPVLDYNKLEEQFSFHLLNQMRKYLGELPDILYGKYSNQFISNAKGGNESPPPVLSKPSFRNRSDSFIKPNSNHGDFEGLSIDSKAQHLFEILAYYLQNGFFPWWAFSVSWIEFENSLIQTLSTDQRNWVEIANILSKNENATLRLALQFSDQVYHLLLKSLKKQVSIPNSASNLLLGVLTNEAQKKGIELDQSFAFRYLQVKLLLAPDNRLIFRQLSKYFTFKNFSRQDHLVFQLISDTLQNQNYKADFEPFRQAWFSSAEYTISKKPKLDTKAANKAKINLPLDEDQHQYFLSAKSSTNRSKHLGNSEIYINNAGLVILLPFLEIFFKDLGFLDSTGKFIDHQYCNKAVLILQYLAKGILSYHEPELVLNKIICGLPVEAIVDTKQKIKSKEIKEAKQLIQQVIGHWKSLGNTSIDGLREAFLNREAKISFYDHSFRLNVSQKSIDVLLERLPWTISILKSPWMHYPLYVDWV